MTLPPFQTLLDEHAADLHRFLVASVGPHDGADCFQETVISALRAYPDLRHAGQPAGLAVHDRPPQGRSTTPAGSGELRCPWPNRRRWSCDADALRLDGDADLSAAVRALPPKQRTAVVQRYLLDRPYAEVAEVIGCSEDAARQNVRAGLQRLRQELATEVTA